MFLFKRSSKDVRPLNIIITGTSFSISDKGKMIIEQICKTDDECIAAIAAYLKKKKPLPPKVQLLFSGDKLISQTRVVKYSNKEEFVADEGMLDRLIQNAEETFLEEYKIKEPALMTKTTLTISLNGYVVPKLHRQKVNDLQVTVFFSALSATYKKKTLESLAFLGKNRLVLSVLAEQQTDSIFKSSGVEEFLVASVYANSSDISVRKQKNFFETINIPIGTHHVIEHLKNGLAISEEQAISYLSQYNDGKISEELSQKLDDAIKSFQISLDNEMKKALTLLSAGVSLPSDIYLSISKSFAKIYENTFRSDSYHSLNFSEKGFEVKTIESIIIP